MSVASDTREQLAALKVEVAYLKTELAEVKDTLKELRDAFLEGRGGVKTAKFGLRLIWLGVGGVVTAFGLKFSQIIPWLSLPPR